MNEEQVKEILKSAIKEDNSLGSLDGVFGGYIDYDSKSPKSIVLDGEFSQKEVEAISWWMENKSDNSRKQKISS